MNEAPIMAPWAYLAMKHLLTSSPDRAGLRAEILKYGLGIDRGLENPSPELVSEVAMALGIHETEVTGRASLEVRSLTGVLELKLIDRFENFETKEFVSFEAMDVIKEEMGMQYAQKRFMLLIDKSPLEDES